MGFFTKQQAKQFTDIDLLHQYGCKLCPLYSSNAQNKDIKPMGSTKPDILLLGQSPSKIEDLQSTLFIGRGWELVRAQLTQQQILKIRVNTFIRTRTPGDRDPSFEETECCRPSIESDILLYKPKAVFALGGLATNWFLQQTKAPSINAWRGHKFPAQVGDHKFWVFPMFHPKYILETPYMEPVFKLDIINAYKFLERNLEPEIVDLKTIWDNCHCLYKVSDIRKGLLRLLKEPEIEIDLETTATRTYTANAKILSMSFGCKDFAISFGWKHPQAKWTTEEFEELRKLVLFVLRNKKQVKIAHNASFELEWLIQEFDDPSLVFNNWRDTMSQSYILGYGGNVKSSEGESEKLFKGLLSLDNLCRVYLGFFLKNQSNIDRTKLEYTPLEEVLHYNNGDTKFGHWIFKKLEEDIKHEGLESIVAEHDRRIPSVVLMQRKGLVPSIERALEHQKQIESKINKIITDTYADQAVIEYQSKYSEFNLASPANAAALLGSLGFNVKKKVRDSFGKEKETIAADDEILKAIDHPVAKYILEYRELSKLKSTYCDIFLPNPKNYIVFPDGLIHGEFTTHFTTSGRTSSNHPNLQNFPKRKNKEIRDIIVAPPDHKMWSFDYGQLEYRVLVMASKDPLLIKYVKSGKDIHSDWALKIAKRYPKRVSGETLVKKWASANIITLKDEDKLFKAFRDVVKNNWVFACFYGAGDKKLSEAMSLPIDIVKILHEEFWQEFAGVKKWHEWAYNFYTQHGYIETLTKRRRYAPMKGGEIINHPIQGTGSDLVIDAMERLSRFAIETNQPQFQPVLNIHDDLGFYLPTVSELYDAAYITRTMLTTNYKFVNVPLAVEASTGPNWATQKGVGTFTSDHLDQIIFT